MTFTTDSQVTFCQRPVWKSSFNSARDHTKTQTHNNKQQYLSSQLQNLNMTREQSWRDATVTFLFVPLTSQDARQLAVQLTWHLCDTSCVPTAALRGPDPGGHSGCGRVRAEKSDTDHHEHTDWILCFWFNGKIILNPPVKILKLGKALINGASSVDTGGSGSNTQSIVGCMRSLSPLLKSAPF